MKPEGYPLPWNHKLDLPYWKLNLAFCLSKNGWGDFQTGKHMDTLIPLIDKALEEKEEKALEVPQ